MINNINITDHYTQVTFELLEQDFKYTGLCNIKENYIMLTSVTIYKEDQHVGNMTIRKDQGISIAIPNSKDLDKITQFTEILYQIQSNLEETFIKNEL